LRHHPRREGPCRSFFLIHNCIIHFSINSSSVGGTICRLFCADAHSRGKATGRRADADCAVVGRSVDVPAAGHPGRRGHPAEGRQGGHRRPRHRHFQRCCCCCCC